MPHVVSSAGAPPAPFSVNLHYAVAFEFVAAHFSAPLVGGN